MEALNNILFGKINVFILDHESDRITNCIFKKKGDTVDKLKTEFYASISEALSAIPPKSDIIVVIQGRSILTKLTTENTPNEFSEIDLSDFYNQTSFSKKGIQIQSIYRKEHLDKITELPDIGQHFLIGVYLEPTIIPYLEGHVESLTIHSYGLTYIFNNSVLSEVEYNAENESTSQISISGRAYNISEAIALSSLLEYFRKDSSENDIFSSAKIESLYRRRFNLLGWSAITIIFVLLLINFLLYTSSGNKINTLKENNADDLAKLEHIEYLRSQLAEYEAVVHQFPGNTKYAFSYYLDRFGSLRPNGLWYNSLEVFPKKDIVGGKKIEEFEMNIIRLEGEVSNPQILSDFVKTLQLETWVKDISLRNYQKHKENQSGEFNLEILL